MLAVDVSGSMTGERALTAAATVGALAGELGRDRLAVLAFWSDAAVLVRPGERVAPLAVLDLLLRVPTRGLTNVAFALTTAARMVGGTRDARVLLLSDAVHNAGPDPRGVAARLPRLDVLLDVSGRARRRARPRPRARRPGPLPARARSHRRRAGPDEDLHDLTVLLLPTADASISEAFTACRPPERRAGA